MDAAARTAHDSTLQPFSEMEHYKHADELPPEIMADSYDKLERLCLKYMNEDDFSKVEQAYCFAAEKHCNQKRRSGEMYINHPVEVAIILADLKMDCDVVCAALLHDTVEDTETSLADVSGLFGDTVAELVDGVTKLTNIEVDSMDEKQALTLRKMFLAMSKDIRVIIVKLADRLHNMRTLAALREDRRLFKARETMDGYAPLADRLGMSSIKWELEDLSFFYLEPDAYQRIARMVAESREVRERYLAETIKTLTDELNRIGLEGFQINGRSKHYWSIYQKMKRKGKEFSEIYDLVALRVITHSVRDCYSTLGAVHTLWHPMPGRFKDYIAMPKVNNYQSLHTTVIGPTARPLEIQIRTYEMHEQAEYGIAAHWLYKKSGGSSASKTNDAQRLDDQINWLKHSLDWAASDEITDAKEYLHSLKVDLFDQEIFVFTPKGEVMALRAGSTPLDFAYAVHTEVGNHCVGAKINGAVAPLTHEIKTGDRVEILTNKSSKPSRDWLKIVKTPSAKSKIRRYFAAATKDDDAAAGRDILAKDLRKRGYGISTPRSTRALNAVAEQFNFKQLEDLFAAVGKENSTLESICDDTIVYGEGRPQELVFYLLIGRILYRSGNFDAYPRFADELKNLAFALAQVRKQADAKCLKYAQDYCKEPYNIWIGSGDLWPTAYSYSMCVLEESQWIRTKSVSSPEFFHGTLELLEDDVCTTLLLTEGPTRAQDERVKAFAARHTKKLTCFDTKEYALPGISDEFRPLLSPVVMAAVLQRISKNIEVITDHSLDIRRYYRKESY